MNLQGKVVKVFFKNNVTIEGIVRSWSSGLSILDSVSGPECLIIHETLHNVMMVKVLANSEPQKPRPVSWQEPLPETTPQLPAGQLETNAIQRAKKLAEIRQQQIQEHKIRLAEKMHQGNIVGADIRETNYEYPDFTKYKPINRSKS